MIDRKSVDNAEVRRWVQMAQYRVQWRVADVLLHFHRFRFYQRVR